MIALILFCAALYFFVPAVYGGFIGAGFSVIDSVIFTGLLPIVLYICCIVVRLFPNNHRAQNTQFIDRDYNDGGH